MDDRVTHDPPPASLHPPATRRASDSTRITGAFFAIDLDDFRQRLLAGYCMLLRRD
jgi:hypothetical protein